MKKMILVLSLVLMGLQTSAWADNSEVEFVNENNIADLYDQGLVDENGDFIFDLPEGDDGEKLTTLGSRPRPVSTVSTSARLVEWLYAGNIYAYAISHAPNPLSPALLRTRYFWGGLIPSNIYPIAAGRTEAIKMACSYYRMKYNTATGTQTTYGTSQPVKYNVVYQTSSGINSQVYTFTQRPVTLKFRCIR